MLAAARGANQFAGFGEFNLLANLEKIKHKILRNLDNINELKIKFSCLDTFMTKFPEISVTVTYLV